MKTGGKRLFSGRMRRKGGGGGTGDCCGIWDPWEVLVWAAGTEGCRGEGAEKARVRSAETGSADPDAASAKMNGGTELQEGPSGPSRTVSCLFAASPVFPG